MLIIYVTWRSGIESSKFSQTPNKESESNILKQNIFIGGTIKLSQHPLKIFLLPLFEQRHQKEEAGHQISGTPKKNGHLSNFLGIFWERNPLFVSGNGTFFSFLKNFKFFCVGLRPCREDVFHSFGKCASSHPIDESGEI